MDEQLFFGINQKSDDSALDSSQQGAQERQQEAIALSSDGASVTNSGDVDEANSVSGAGPEDGSVLGESEGVIGRRRVVREGQIVSRRAGAPIGMLSPLGVGGGEVSHLVLEIGAAPCLGGVLLLKATGSSKAQTAFER